MVEREVSGSVLRPEHVAVLVDDQARHALRDLVAVLERRVAEHVAALAPSSLLELVALHERALLQSTIESVGLPARDALENADEHLGAREAVGPRNMALRALVERFSAVPPTGQRTLGTREAGWLRASVELEITLGSAYEALASGQTSGRIVVGDPVGVLVQLEGPLSEAGERMTEQLEQAAPRSYGARASRIVTGEPNLPSRYSSTRRSSSMIPAEGA